MIREAHQEFYAAFLAALKRGETPNLDKPALAARILEIIRTESVKPADEAEALQDELEASILERLGVRRETLKNTRRGVRVLNARKYTDEDWKKYRADFNAGKISAVQWRLFEREYFDQHPAERGKYFKPEEPAKARQSFMPEHRQGWAAGVDYKRGISTYRRDPETGKIIWDSSPLEWTFAKRYDLSGAVWKAVDEEEQAIFDIVRGGRAMGRDAVHVAADLETYINRSADGGKRVLARWGRMQPATEKGISTAWQEQYIREHGKIPGTLEARELMKEPDSRQWLQDRLAAKTRTGRQLLPDAVKEYQHRIGTAGIDYRTMRIMRTETAAQMNDRQAEIARNSDISDGTVDWVLDTTDRNEWNCGCKAAANIGGTRGEPWKIDDPTMPPIPLHPNCLAKRSWILTARGYRRIEKIKHGDFVISHDGKAHAVTAIYETDYSGEMVRLNGGAWSTPKHCYYSDGQFVEAQALNKGDSLTAIIGNGRSSSFVNTIPNNRPPEGLYEGSFIIVLSYLFRAGIVPFSAVYFNGKFYIGKSNVDVIFSYCESGDWSIAEVEEFVIKQGFVEAGKFPLPSAGTTFKIGIRALHSLYRIMRRIGIRPPSKSVDTCARFFEPGRGDSNSNQLPVYCPTGNPKDLGNGVHRQAVFFKKRPQSFGVNISFDTHRKIISKNHLQYKGKVFDLTVDDTNSYIANGYVVHNCSCQLRPHIKTDEEMLAALREEFKEAPEALKEEAPEALYVEEEPEPEPEPPEEVRQERLSDKEIKELQEQSNEVYKMLTRGNRDTEKEAVDTYTVGGHDNINPLLYGKLKTTAQEAAMYMRDAELMDSAIGKFKLKKDIVAFSGTKASHYAGWEVGKAYPIPAYLSTAVDESFAKTFYNNAKREAKPIMLEVRIPKGSKGLYIGANTEYHKGDEKEFLLARDLKYKVIERKRVKNIDRLILEVMINE